MALSITRHSEVSSGRNLIIDMLINGTYNISLITLSCGGADPNWEIYIDKDISDIGIPNLPSLAASTTGGTILRSTRIYVRITAIDATGEETALTEGGNFKVTGSGTDTNKITATWSALTGAVSYNVYASLISGSEMFVGNISSSPFVITDMPPAFDLTTAPRTSCDICVVGKKGGVEPLPLAGGGLQMSYRLIVYVNVSAGATPSFCLIAT